jgi:thiol-disulfide isomerase/thioredoxin
MVRPLIWGCVSLCLFVQNVSAFQADNSILYFQSSQCEPCRQQEKSLAVVQQHGWNIQKVDAPSQLDLARRYGITNLPTLIVLAGDREVDRLVGLVSLEQLQIRLKRVAARSGSMAPTPSSNSSQSLRTPASLAAGMIAIDKRNSPSNAAARQNQPIVRGQSPDSVDRAFPRLASNGSQVSQAGVNANASASNMFDDWPRSNRPSDNRNTATPAGFQADNAPLGTELNQGTGSRLASGSAENPRPALQAEPISLASAISRASDATVRIKVEEPKSIAHGTGTIVAVQGDEALVLTCGHMFRDMIPGSQLTVDLFAGTPRQVNLVAQLIDFKADKEDIGLLSVRLPVKVEPVPILPKNESLQIGQAVFSIGCDHGNNPTRRDTKISNINRYLGPANVEIVGAPATGRSGGGLFDSQGRLIGVCNAASVEDNEGIYAAADVIYAQLARIDHAHLFEPKAQATLASASSERPASTAVAGHTRQPSAPTNSLWPDEDSRLDSTSKTNRPGQSPPTDNANIASADSNSAAAQQLICIVRDASGNDRIVSINQPSPQLLQAIEQHDTIRR